MSQPSIFLSARWIHLVMLNYEVDPAVLLPHVPAGTELDTFGGRTFASMVGFQFLDTRVMGLPIPFHQNFDEVNLRFYVRREEAGELRRGVVFIKEIVPRAAIAWVARTVYNEPYVALRMHHYDEIGSSSAPRVSYAWEFKRQTHRLGAKVEGEPFLPGDESEETFITEHYWGYSRQRDGRTMEYQVEHLRWNVWRAVGSEFICDVAALYGPQFEPHLKGTPSSAFLADGSEVIVRRGRVIS